MVINTDIMMSGVIKINHILKTSIILVLTITLSACSFNTNVKKSTESSSKSAIQVQAPLPSAPIEESHAQAPIKIPTIEEVVTTLCSDEFQGRLVGSTGNDKYVIL